MQKIKPMIDQWFKRRKGSLCSSISLSHPMVTAPLIFMVSILLLVAGPGFIYPLNAQPLDEVIEDLLDDGVTGECAALEAAGVSLDPGSPLAVFCSNANGGDPSSTGGSAGTPTTAPGIVKERLESVRDDQKEESESGVVSDLTAAWSVFFSAEGERLDRDGTRFEEGYDSGIWRLTVGTNYQLADRSTIGLALTYSNQDGDFDGGGDFENDSYGLLGFVAFAPTEKCFIQGTLGYTRHTYERTRDVEGRLTGTPAGDELSGLVSADFDGNEISAGVLAGSDHAIGRLTIGPRIGLDWIFTEFDEYTEKGTTGLELVFDDADETSIQSRIGFAGSLAISTGFGVLIPQLSADWVHEFANDQRNLAFSFAADENGIKFTYEDEKPDNDFLELAVGVSAVLPNGWLPYIQFRAIAAHDFLNRYVGSVGLRKEF